MLSVLVEAVSSAPRLMGPDVSVRLWLYRPNAAAPSPVVLAEVLRDVVPSLGVGGTSVDARVSSASAPRFSPAPEDRLLDRRCAISDGKYSFLEPTVLDAAVEVVEFGSTET